MPHKKFSITLPTMTPGTTRQVTVHRFGKAGARPKAYLQAAIHANELPGAMALHHLMPMLMQADQRGLIKGEIIVVPMVNPIGLAQLTGNTHLGRYDFLGRENFNRNWLDVSQAVARQVDGQLGRNAQDNVDRIRKAVRKALDEHKPQNELHTLRTEIQKLSMDADLVLDLHCDAEAALHLFLSGTDTPGAAEELAADIGVEAALYNAPYPTASTFSGTHSALWGRLRERFPDAAIPQACMSATIEYRSQHEVNHALGEVDAQNLYRHLVRRGMIAGRAGKLPPLKTQCTPMEGMDVGYAPAAGMLVYHLPKGAQVRKGDAVCEIIDPTDPRGPKARRQILARTDGVLFSRKPDGRLAWPGAVVFRIAGAKPLAHRKGLTGLDD